MSQYNWPKRYEIPEVCFKTEKNSYEPKGFDTKLRETIDVSSVRNNDLNPKTDRNKTSFTQSLRHTTDQRTTLTDLLGKSYKYFEPRACKLKNDSAHNATFDNFHYDPSNKSKYSNYEPQTNASNREGKIKSLKEINEYSRDHTSVNYKNDKMWSSTKLIHFPTSIEELKTPEKHKDSEEAQSPYTFIKKNKLLYTTPQSTKLQRLDETSTKYGSSNNSLDSSLKFLSLRQVKKEPIKPPTLNDLAIVKNLGEGRFGTVSMAIHKITGLLVAIKKVKKAVIKAHKLENQFTMEVKMQLFLDHPNILKLYGYFDDSEHIYLILEFMEQGTLFSKLKKEKEKHLDQRATSQKMDDILHAIKYMHNLQVAHRDIKPENVVMSNGVCKLCDFGWAALCQNRRTTLCGTIDYAPPQVLEGKEYGLTMDLWCLGVLCYELVVGKAPFYHVSRKQTMQKIIKADTSELKLPEQLSSESIDFISKLLVKDPEERMSAEDALEHKFIKRHVERDDHQSRRKYL